MVATTNKITSTQSIAEQTFMIHSTKTQRTKTTNDDYEANLCLNEDGERCAMCWSDISKCYGEPKSNCGKYNGVWCPDTNDNNT